MKNSLPLTALSGLFSGFSGSFGAAVAPTFTLGSDAASYLAASGSGTARSPRPWLRAGGYYQGRSHRSQVERSNRRKASQKAPRA